MIQEILESFLAGFLGIVFIFVGEERLAVLFDGFPLPAMSD